jgi:hypothetical protein
MNKIKYLLLSFILLNVNFSKAMYKRSGALGRQGSQLYFEPKVNANAKRLARFFIAEINDSEIPYQSILTSLRTRRDSLGLDLDNKLMLACSFENFSNVLLNYFNTNDLESFSVAALTLPLNFEVFFGRINEACKYEQDQLMRLLFSTGTITIAEITEINDLSQRLASHESFLVNGEFYKFITRANLLSTIKYSLHDDRVRAVVFKNLLRFKLASLRKLRKYLGENNFGSPLLAGEDKIAGIMGVFGQINSDLLRVNFLSE